MSLFYHGFFCSVQQVACLICFLLWQMFFGGDTHRGHLSGHQEVKPEVLFCRLRLFCGGLIVFILFLWRSNWIINWPTEYFKPVLIHHSCIHFYCILVWTNQRIFCLFPGTPFYYGPIEEVSSRCYLEPVGDILCMVRVKILVDKVWVILSLVDFILSLFKETLKRTLIFLNILVF